MAWFRKQKTEESREPQLCQRCGRQLGTIHLRRIGGSPDERSSLWLCTDCARVLRNDARDS